VAECVEVKSESEAEVTIRLLENALKERPDCFSVSAPEVGIMKKVAIIRLPDLSVNVVNPKLIKLSGHSLSLNERCFTFPAMTFNCLRFEQIVFENGVDKKVTQADGTAAYVIQHEIDHFNNIYCINRIIRLAVVRDDRLIRPSGLCVCGSKKRFKDCCQSKV